jgi:Holliday junction resolvasome RuvABC endonuclease subunit
MSDYLYAFDLSMECTGLTVFDLGDYKPVLVTSISTSHFKKSATHGQKLKYIEEEVIKIGKKYQPKIVCIERGFSRFNTSTQVIYRVHGIINKLFHNYEQIYYPPKTVKEAICRGDATKKYVQDTIHSVYPDIEFANEDESDSFAVGLTYLIKNEYISWNKPGIKKKSTKRRLQKE